MYELSTLDNGLRIVTHRLSGRDSVGLAFWVRVGGRYEKKELGGISHFLEHMLFKGTRRRSTKQIKEDIEGVGGMLNAFTGEESTCYVVKIPKPHLKVAFDVLQDMINNASLRADDFEKERTVILEEIKMYLDLPSQYVHEMMSELLWPSHPLGRPIAGTVDSVSGLRRSHLVHHLHSYYHPKNLLITVCGEVGHGEIKALAEGYFNGRSQKPISRFQRTENSLVGNRPRFQLMDKKTEQTHFVIGFHGLSRIHPDRYRLAILNIILGANMSSRLFEEVREQRGLAYEIKSALSFFLDTGAISISAGVEPKKAPLAVRVIMRELGRLKQEPVSKSELKRAKDYFLGQMVLGLEDTLEHALWYGEHVLYEGELPNSSEIRRHVEEVKESDIQNLARRFFRTGGIHLTLIGPMDSKLEHKIKSESVCP